MNPVDGSTEPKIDVWEIIKEQRAIERQNAETFRTHNIITKLMCVAWTLIVCGFLIFGPDFMGIRAAFARAETSEDAMYACFAVIAVLAPVVWAPLYLFVGARRRWPPVKPSAVVRAQAKE